jgi:ribosomal protein L34E
VIYTFRDPRAVIHCTTCGKPLEGIPMDRGDFLFVIEDAVHPHSIFPKQAAA